MEMNECTKLISHSFVLSWSHLHVEARTSAILRDLTGFARPGQVLAIMGTSGVGMHVFLTFDRIRY